MNVLQRQFLEISVKVDIAGGWRVEGEERRGIAGEVCDSITHNMQFIM